jgi:hypothetical protein
MYEAMISGYLVAISLIAAIGAQNAFVLRQGIRREHVLAVVLVCALSEVPPRHGQRPDAPASAVCVRLRVAAAGTALEGPTKLSQRRRY